MRPTRRDFMYGLGATLGTVAFNAMLRAENGVDGPLAPRPGHHRPRAKSCIFLFMEGGPSHIDTFDPKPKLADLHMTEFSRQGDRFASAMASGKRYYIRSPFKFRQVGQAGLWMSDRFQHLPGVADRSEEHTSELQSPCNLVCRLLLEEKNNNEGCLYCDAYIIE